MALGLIILLFVVIGVLGIIGGMFCNNLKMVFIGLIVFLISGFCLYGYLLS